MREQKQYNTDRGWAAMQQILDREMPRRRRRRIAGWWFAGLLLPVLGIAGWYLYQQQHTSQPLPVLPAQAISGAPLAERASASDLPVNIHTVAAVSNESPKNTATSTKLHPFSKPAATAPDVLNAHPTAMPAWLAMKDGMATNELSVILVPDGVNLENGMVEQTFLPDQSATMPENALSSLPMLSPPVATEGDTLHFATYPAYSNTAVTKKLPYRASWEFGPMAGINSERLPRINGGVIGMVADWQPLRHWGLRSGLQYAVQRLASDESLVTTISEDSYERYSDGLAVFDQSGNYGNLNQFAGINTNILASVRRIHRIEAPLLVYWQPVRKLRAYIGATMNYTFLAQTSPRIFSENQVYKVVSGRDELNRLATEKLNRWQVKWQLGLGYRIGRVIEVNAGIQAALPSISLQKDGGLGQEQNPNSHQSISIEQIHQLGVTVRGIVFF